MKEEGTNFCDGIAPSDKVGNISITKQPRWFYYMAMESEECWQVELPIILSLQHPIITVNAWESQMGTSCWSHNIREHGGWVGVGQAASSQGQIPPKWLIRWALGLRFSLPQQYIYDGRGFFLATIFRVVLIHWASKVGSIKHSLVIFITCKICIYS